MEKELQRIILRIIYENNGRAPIHTVRSRTEVRYWGLGGMPEDSAALVMHQLDLLEKDEKIIRKDLGANIYCILLPAGHRVLEPWLKRSWYFVLYDKHNLFVILSLLVSIFALWASFSALSKSSRSAHNSSDIPKMLDNGF